MKIVSITVTDNQGWKVTAKVITDTYFATAKELNDCCRVATDYLKDEWVKPNTDPKCHVEHDLTVFLYNPVEGPIEMVDEDDKRRKTNS